MRSSFFSLGCFRCFGTFNVRVWSVSCVIGLGSLVPAFFFLSYRSPRSVLGPGWSLLLVRLLFLLPSCRPPHSVLVHGLGNRATKLRHGTVGFSCSSFCRPADAPLNSEPGGGQGNPATLTVAQDCMFCLLFFCDARYFVFSLL